MPTILRIDGYRFYFYSHEPNEPPHVHVDKAEATGKVWLEVVEFARHRGFRSPSDPILSIVQEHREPMPEAWNEHFG